MIAYRLGWVRFIGVACWVQAATVLFAALALDKKLLP